MNGDPLLTFILQELNARYQISRLHINYYYESFHHRGEINVSQAKLPGEPVRKATASTQIRVDGQRKSRPGSGTTAHAPRAMYGPWAHGPFMGKRTPPRHRPWPMGHLWPINGPFIAHEPMAHEWAVSSCP